MKNFLQVWKSKGLIERSFNECGVCIKDVLDAAEGMLQSPEGTPAGFEVRLAAISPETYTLKRNLFSTLFQSVYHLLGIEEQRRLFYGKLNHLFRIWVTSADNLLDNEDKVVVPIEIAGSSRVMRQVISIMLADRIMHKLTTDAVRNGVLSEYQSQVVSEKSLQILLPSAAEEASEESGVSERPNADYVLNTIHRLKTGLLFHIPFLGPEHIEENLDSDVLKMCKDGLMSFGLGCQLLDDIRDLAKDLVEARHNYVLSFINAEQPVYAAKLEEIKPEIALESNIYGLFPKAVIPAGQKALGLLRNGLVSLGSAGLGIDKAAVLMLSLTMFETLGVGDLISCLTL